MPTRTQLRAAMGSCFLKHYLLTHIDGSSLLMMGDNAATSRGDKKMKTRASDRGRYCRDQYRLATTPKPKAPLSISSHFLHITHYVHSA